MEVSDRSRILNINVGVLGHVDSGKTSLVKALSTSLSTAALDKNPQSQQRGITLDLGFSAFTLPLPERLLSLSSDYDFLQFTLVDCPGHASLIRTIIGGAQIIDMMILVVDANKGIQTQTAECIVIGEITTDKMIIVLNKIDMIPEDEREAKLDKVTKRIQKVLSTTKFHDAPIVYTSAAVGGEKVASIGASAASGASAPSYGIDSLLQLVSESVKIPQRVVDGPFYFAIDHCFAIKGHGTVVTGTVLSGSVSVNSIIEIPNMQVQRKVKSMQMFKKPVKYAQQGDRVGICLTSLDPKSIERGVAASPGSIPQLSTVICLVKKVRFFKTPCKSNTKFHVSVGHSTVVGNVVFFGALEMALLLEQRKQRVVAAAAAAAEAESTGKLTETAHSSKKKGHSFEDDSFCHQSILNANYQSSFPDVDFSFEQHYQYQEELMGFDGVRYGNEPVQWAVIQFQQPVYCPIGSLVIGSRLDADTSDSAGVGSSHQCRLSFFGPVRHALDSDFDKLNIFNWKMKEGTVFKISDVRDGLCTELIGQNMFGEGSSIHPFIGMKVNTERGNMGTIMGPYGSDGKFRVKFEPGIRISVGSSLRMRFKRFLYDKSRSMEQTGVEEVIDDAVTEPEEEMKIVDTEVKQLDKRKAARKADAVAVATNFSNALDVPLSQALKSPTAPFNPVISKPVAAVSPKPPVDTPSAPPGLSLAPNTTPSPPLSGSANAASDRVGVIESCKPDDDGNAVVVVVRDAFRMEENIKLHVNCAVLGPNGEVGSLVGPFGKLGKCKVRFALGLNSNSKVGDALSIKLA